MLRYSINLDKSLKVENENEFVEIQFYDNFVRISRNGKFNNLELINLSKNLLKRKVKAGLEIVKIDSKRLAIYSNKYKKHFIFDENCYVTILDKDKKVVLSEYTNKEKTKIIKQEKDFSLSVLEGHKHEVEYYDFKTQINISLFDKDCIYGLGDKASFIDKRGYEYVQYNNDDPSQHNETYKSLYKSINFVMLRNFENNYCGICYLSTYKTIFNLGCYSSDFLYIASFKGEYDYFVIFGEKPSAISQTYRSFFEDMYIPPLKMLGYHQSRWSYKTENEVLDIFEKFKKYDLPIDYIHLDIDYMDRYMVYTIDDKKFPNITNLIKTLSKDGVSVIPIIDPAVKKLDGYFLYDYMKEHDLFAKYNNEDYVNVVWPGDSCYPNYFKKETRNYLTDVTEEFLDKYKFGGIWTDMNEPASFNGPLPDDVDFSNENRTILHDEVHNLYASYMTKTIAEAFIKNNIRPCVITRASFNDTFVYSTCWNGDNQSLYAHLETSLPQIASMNLSNFVFNGVDIGGFGNECTKELLIRWVEANCFSLFFRNHSTINSRFQEPFAFDEECLNIYRKYLKLHYKFIPYLYTLLHDNYVQGTPVIAPMFYYNHEDLNCLRINDQVMIGENMILSPILQQGKTHRSVYLPKGNWINYFTNQKFKGGKFYDIELNIDQLGLFIKEDAIIPVFKDDVSHLNMDKYNIDFLYYKNKAKGHLYEDDGETNNYRNGEFNKYELKVVDNKIEIRKIYSGLKLNKFNF